MKKIIMSIIFAACSLAMFANDSTQVVLPDSAVVVSVDSVAPMDTVPARQPLTMSVAVPTLEWDKVGYSSARHTPDYMFVPLIYEKYMNDSVAMQSEVEIYELDVNDEWLKSSIKHQRDVRARRFGVMVKNPQHVQFNEKDLPEPPKRYVITTDPSKRMVTIEERKIDEIESIEGEKVKIRNWIHSFAASVQFSQAYLSDNWYQGGENNVNVVGNFVWNVKLNDIIHKKLLFENTVQYKVSVNSAPQDSVRGYSISQDLFQVNTKFGYKAIEKWYYSASMQFKTQIFNNYTANTNDMRTAFLSPAELNLGVGMTYANTFKDGKLKFDMSLAPLSVDMNICREIKKIDPTSFGIEAGKRFKAEYGSNVEGKMVWKLCPEVVWTSRIFAFTNYDHLQGDWENTLDFSINKYLSTRFYAHLRYDNSVAKHMDWKYWQFNEILSFGFNYTFSMK